MTKSMLITLLALGSQFALAGNDVIDPKLVDKIDIQVSEERDAGKICIEWYRSGQRLVSNMSYDVPCSEVTKLKKKVYTEQHMIEKDATPVITMKDGSEIRLETIHFDRDLNESELPWGFEAPLEGWKEEAKAILAGGKQVYFKDHCFRKGLRTKIVFDRRVGGTLYHATQGQIFEHCADHPAADIEVVE